VTSTLKRSIVTPAVAEMFAVVHKHHTIRTRQNQGTAAGQAGGELTLQSRGKGWGSPCKVKGD